MATVLAFKKLAKQISKDLEEIGIRRKYMPMDLVKIFKTYRGRCAYCGVPCVPNGTGSDTRLFFNWYTPLDRGGIADVENLVPACRVCLSRYRHSRRLRETIPDVNTFGDLVHHLVQATITTTRLKSDNNIEAFRWEEKVNRIKRSINILLEDIVLSMQYKPFTDWKIDKAIMHEEGINTIPDMIESMIKKELVEEPVDKNELNNAAKQLLVTKQYKIIRKEKE